MTERRQNLFRPLGPFGLSCTFRFSSQLSFWFQRLSIQIVCAGRFGTNQGNGNSAAGFPQSFHSLIRAMRTGSTVNAAAVENTIPPNMTVANLAWAPELAPINAMGKTPTNAHSPMRKTSRNFA